MNTPVHRSWFQEWVWDHRGHVAWNFVMLLSCVLSVMHGGLMLGCITLFLSISGAAVYFRAQPDEIARSDKNGADDVTDLALLEAMWEVDALTPRSLPIAPPVIPCPVCGVVVLFEPSCSWTTPHSAAEHRSALVLPDDPAAALSDMLARARRYMQPDGRLKPEYR